MSSGLLALLLVSYAGAVDYDAAAKEARGLLEELVAADTTNPPGNEARVARLGAKRLEAAGIEFELLEFGPGRENLLARLPGSGAEPPLLLLAHTDLVGNANQPWTSDPHRVTEKDGYLVGRGVLDDLGMASLELQTLLILKRAKVPLKRDVILAWTGDEESDGLGLRDLFKKKPELLKVGLAINESGGAVLGPDGKVTRLGVSMAEKVYQDFALTAKGASGHSSAPVSDNAIYKLSAALDRVGRARFPAYLLPVTRAYLTAIQDDEAPPMKALIGRLLAAKGELPADAMAEIDAKHPTLAALLHTTCVATLVSGGTRANALPAEAKATVNCRILPGEPSTDVRKILVAAVADPSVEVAPKGGFTPSPASPAEGPGPDAIARTARKVWPGVVIVPNMSRGATDSEFLRSSGIPAYGILPMPLTDEDRMRMHGADERIPVGSLRQGLEFLHQLVLELAEKR
ncbi:MAG: M20/M25/M40 family metallo-hydrolase [Elusimicrobia bacterium]|nr:M20/M25/M40 family metallo-hydrolase [Elusimicrobiota bacterium]